MHETDRRAQFLRATPCAKVLSARARVGTRLSKTKQLPANQCSACSQLENHFLVDTHKNFSCFFYVKANKLKT